MFVRSAPFYDALYAFMDYSSAAKRLHELIQERCPGAKTLLDVACGTGKHLEFLREHYQVEGLDLNPELIRMAATRCPDVPFHRQDMIHFDLDRRFDVVTCLFSSIGYVKTVENLVSSIQSMARHLKKPGLLVVEPWFTPQEYWTDRCTANFVNEPELKIAWMYLSKSKDKLAILDIHFLVGRREGVDYFTERHEIGLFTHEEYLESFRRAALQVTHDPEGLFRRGLYLGVFQG